MPKFHDRQDSKLADAGQDMLHAPLDRYQRIVVSETELAPLSRMDALSRVEAQRSLAYAPARDD